MLHMHFINRIFTGFIGKITLLVKIDVSIQETRIIAWRSSQAYIPLCTDASHNTQGSDALNTQLPSIIAERTIHYGLLMNGLSFGQN